MEPKENLIRAITRQDPAYVPYYGGADRTACPMQQLHFFGATPFDYQQGRQRWTEELFGVEHEASEGLVGFPAVVGSPLKSLDDLDRFPFPDPYVPDRFQRVREQIDTQTYLAGGAHRACLFSRAWSLLSMEGLMLEMAARPDLVKALLRRIADFNVGIAEQYIAAGVELGMISDDWGTQRALMISPAMWREFVKPELARIVRVYKEAGCYVQIHSCGHVEEVVADLVELGVDILNPIQARANNLAWLKAQYGSSICFSGGVDSHETLMLGTPEAVVAETKERLRVLAPGGGYLLGPDQSMPFPKENLQALLDTARQYGRYPLAL